MKISTTLIIAPLLLAGCDSSSTTATSNVATSSDSAAPLPLGKTGSANGIDFTVNDVITRKDFGMGQMGPSTAPGETFVVVGYTIKNTAKKPLGIMDRPQLNLIGPDGQTYAPDDIASGLATTSLKDASDAVADLNPNVSAKVKAAWKVDRKAFDKATWKLVLDSDPQLMFALK